MREVGIRRKRGQFERNELSRLVRLFSVFVWRCVCVGVGVGVCGCASDCVGEEGSVRVGQP